MTAATQIVEFNGEILKRGFWIYVLEATDSDGETMLYVGRTGDSSSPNAQSPFNRLGQHLGFAENSNMLRKHLLSHGHTPELCCFRLVAYGPVLAEAAEKTMEAHKPLRDKAGAIERQLAEDLVEASYEVMNTVPGTWSLDEELYAPVRAAFADVFPRLAG